MSTRSLLLTLGIVVASSAGPARAEQQTFRQPMNGAERLDWCLQWGQKCGAPAAHAFCIKRGFPGASSWNIAPDIGGQAPTRTLGDDKVCRDGSCDGFTSITCGSGMQIGGLDPRTLIGRVPEARDTAPKPPKSPLSAPKSPLAAASGAMQQVPTGTVDPKQRVADRAGSALVGRACGLTQARASSLVGVRVVGRELVALPGYRIEKLDDTRVRVWQEATASSGPTPMDDSVCACQDCDGYGCSTNIFGTTCIDSSNCDSYCAWMKEDPCKTEGGDGLRGDPFDVTPGVTPQ